MKTLKNWKDKLVSFLNNPEYTKMEKIISYMFVINFMTLLISFIVVEQIRKFEATEGRIALGIAMYCIGATAVVLNALIYILKVYFNHKRKGEAYGR